MDSEAVSLTLKLVVMLISFICVHFDVNIERCDTRDGVSLAT